MPFISFPSIEQFRNVVKHVRNRAAYVGQDAEGKPIYDGSRPIPTLHFHGTVKLHGTNASVCQAKGERWYQSRSRIITPVDDNAGFAFWSTTNEDKFDAVFSKFPATVAVAVFGEWCGEGIQKSVAIAHLPKRFVVVAVSVDGKWLSRTAVSEAAKGTGLTSIEDFPCYDIKIDFNSPEEAQNQLVRITEEVEAQCPVARSLGIEGIGEGVVWYCTDDGWSEDGSGMWFKVKGEKHSVTKVKTLAAVDIEKVHSVKECIEKICTENRMRQGLDKLREDGLDFDIRNMGAFLKWLASNCIKEEIDTISESGLEPKDVGKAISNKGRLWFIEMLNADAMVA